MFCGECGNQLQENCKFCSRCGAPVECDHENKFEEVTRPSIVQSEFEKKIVEEPKKIEPVTETTDDKIAKTIAETADDKTAETIAETTDERIAETINVIMDKPTDKPTDKATAEIDYIANRNLKKEKKWLFPVAVVCVLTLLGAGYFLIHFLFENKGDKFASNQNYIVADKQDVNTEVQKNVPISTTIPTSIATPSPKPLSEEDSFAQQLVELNSVGAKLESIDVFADNYDPAMRNKDYKWDSKLFYTLEEISPDNSEDGQINSYNIEKKQLINAENGNKMEYEIYRNPENNKVNKIVSIEYADTILKLCDYYYDNYGKVNFTFQRNDVNYIPAYANPAKVGERCYFCNDVLVKWREVKDGKQINYVIGKNEQNRKNGGNSGTVTLYDQLSIENQQSYDQKERDMINAAYNTYNIVQEAKGISNIIGYVYDDNGNPVNNAKIGLYSAKYKKWIFEKQTDQNGLYSIVVPSQEAEYEIKAEYDGYVTTSLYNINMNTQSVGMYQENIYLVKNTGISYNINLILCDAFNKMDENNMRRLVGADVKTRKGINNKTGEIYRSAKADQNGQIYITLEEGVYTVEINKDGYATTYYTVVARKENDVIQINTSPILGEDEVRIVLTWGEKPMDLDSHLFTPNDSSSGDKTFHIWYDHRSDLNYNNLDVDDTNGYGPETMTINHLDNGLYKYYVADFTNCSARNTNSTDMSLSGARVSIYTKAGLVQNFYVPNDRQGVIWELFEIRNKRIVPIQRYYSNIGDKTWWYNEK